MNASDTFRSGYIALIGAPNVGKSTLMNRLIGQKIAITSAKPQTTRNRILTVVTDEAAQMIFLDTPGIHAANSRLDEYMERTAQSVLHEADVLLWLVEPDVHIGERQQRVLSLLNAYKGALFLIINKSDTVHAERLDAVRQAFEAVRNFDGVFYVSALKGEGTDALLEAMKRALPFGPALYEDDTLTDMPLKEIVAEIIREKALRLLKDEVPHGIAVHVEKMRERHAKDKTITDVEASIICEKTSHKGIVIGKGGAMLKKIGQSARKDIERLVETQVNLQLFVKVRQNWRDDALQLNALGYRRS